MELKNNQIEKSLQLLELIRTYGIAYLWGEVRIYDMGEVDLTLIPLKL